MSYNKLLPDKYDKPDKSLIFCGKKSVQGDLYITSMNMGAALLHFLLAVGMVITLSYWKSHEDFEDDLSAGRIFNFISVIMAIGITSASIYFINLNVTQEKNWARQKTGRTVILSIGALTALFAFLGFILSVPYISGTFPIYITLTPNTANPSYPYNTSICEGKDYKDDTVFNWIQCVRDSSKKRNYDIFNITTGARMPWKNAAGVKCDDLEVSACSDTVENGYSSNIACVKCGGGQDCSGRKCFIADNPNSFIQVSGVDSDPSSFIQVGVPQVIVPYKEQIMINPEKVKTYNEATKKWVLNNNINDLEKGTQIKFLHEGLEKGPYDTGEWIGNNKAEHQRAWYNWWFLWVFSVLTCLMHTVLAISGWNETSVTVVKENTKNNCCNEWGYLYDLEMGRQPYRWLEYSVTAAIMFFIVLQLNRVTDLWVVLTTFFLTTVYNVFGAAIDLTDNLIFIIWFWTVSFIAFVVQFAVLFYNTEKTIQPYLDDDLETRDLWAQLFQFVSIVNIAIFTTFLTFPVLNIIHLIYKRRRWKWDSYEDENVRDRNCMYRAEICYIILSFASKGLLVFLVFWGVAARND